MTRLTAGFASSVVTSNQPVLVADPALNSGGGYITNPLHFRDQKLDSAERLIVNIAGQYIKITATALQPGQTFLVPPDVSVWVQAATAGHAFTAVFITTASSTFPPTPQPPIKDISGTVWPPIGPTGLLNVIPSYLYEQYTDDDDCQEFVISQNQLQQNYVDTFNALNLPIYNSFLIAGRLLDWVGQGVYGYSRPALSKGKYNEIGQINTWGPNFLPYAAPSDESYSLINGFVRYHPDDITIADDDAYRRCLTWHVHKGDGKYFNITWLKRRVMRFLLGTDGTSPNIDNTNQISISFGYNYSVCIRFVLGHRTITGGAMPNDLSFTLNGLWGAMPKDLETTYVAYPALPFMGLFQEALGSGVLETPFQFRFTSTIG